MHSFFQGKKEEDSIDNISLVPYSLFVHSQIPPPRFQVVEVQGLIRLGLSGVLGREKREKGRMMVQLCDNYLHVEEATLAIKSSSLETVQKSLLHSLQSQKKKTKTITSQLHSGFNHHVFSSLPLIINPSLSSSSPSPLLLLLLLKPPANPTKTTLHLEDQTEKKAKED